MSGERYVLALDTATAPGGVAIGRGADVLAETVLGVATRHSELVLPAIAFALNAASARMDEIDAIIVGAGPGSFTGVRIAAATAKGLAHARGIPLYAISSLHAAATAATGEPDAAVCALFDARRGEAYAGCWRTGSHEPLLEPTAGPVADIVARLSAYHPLYVGDGAQRYRDRIEAAGGRVGSAGATSGCAGALVRLYAEIGEDARVDAAHWEPTYVRAPNVTMPRSARRDAAGAGGRA